jgi:Holliday junction DNA helicase RuvB
VRDFAQIKKKTTQICQSISSEALELFEVDHKGLDPMDRKLLKLIIDKFEGGPVGIESLSAALGEERDTLEDVYEPYLLQEGFIQRTPRGRTATKQAYDHLGVEYREDSAKRQLPLIEFIKSENKSI